MALHVKCEHCGHILNIPDDMKGKKVKCPNCDEKTVATDHTSKQEAEVKEKQDEPRKKEEDAGFDMMVEKVEPASHPAAPAAQQRQHFDASLPSQYDSLRVMGGVFVFVGYLLGILAIAYGLYSMLNPSGEGWTREGLVRFLACFIAALVIFVVCKFAGELSRVLADLADTDLHIMRLMRDLSDHLSRQGKK